MENGIVLLAGVVERIRQGLGGQLCSSGKSLKRFLNRALEDTRLKPGVNESMQAYSGNESGGVGGGRLLPRGFASGQQ